MNKKLLNKIKRENRSENPINLSLKKINIRIIWEFTRSLAVMLKAKIPLVKALEIIHSQTKIKTFKKVLKDIIKHVTKGTSLKDSLKRYPEIFDETYTQLISVGEATGRLDEVLKLQAEYLEKRYLLRKKVVMSLTYPAIVLIVSFCVVSFLLLFMIPAFSEIFLDLGSDMPVSTKFLLKLSNNYQYFVIVLLAVILILYLGVKNKKKLFHASVKRHRLILSVPIWGNIIQTNFISNFCRTLGILLANGIPLTQCLSISLFTIKNRFIREKIRKLTREIKRGKNLTESIEDLFFFPSVVKQIIAVGESSSNLEESMFYIADIYEQEVDSKIEFLTSIIEPFIIIILGFMIAIIIINLYLPIFNIVNAIGY